MMPIFVFKHKGVFNNTYSSMGIKVNKKYPLSNAQMENSTGKTIEKQEMR